MEGSKKARGAEGGVGGCKGAQGSRHVFVSRLLWVEMSERAREGELGGKGKAIEV